jgi:hypothetical protein
VPNQSLTHDTTNEVNVTTDDDFDYSPLGKEFWMDAMETTKATITQARFACARHAGATRSKAAELAGYSATDGQGYRVAGSRADDTKSVEEMLVMASAAAVTTNDAPYTVAEARAKLGRMVKTSLDPNTVVRGTELLAKLEQVDKDRGETSADDGYEAWRQERDFLTLPNGAVAYLLIHLDTTLMGNVGNLKLLHDTYPRLIKQKYGAELWAESRARLSEEMRDRLDEFLYDPNHQLEDRKKVWAEIGIDITKAAKAA